MTTMNPYGERALTYMREHCPSRLAAIQDPDRYFTAMGEQIAEEVFELEEALAGPAPEGETHLERVGRMNLARLRAEERVFSELLWLPPEEDGEEPPTDETGAYSGRPGWDPLIPDMSDLAAAEAEISEA